ncbi:HD domain-containing phosphohydrolase [uncultured Cetobacterium sp.]|uniref:HD domain-containing phosphohydrolase n=1 Tax=uncultured Cetobacterium sp. TaxID=527638 RepID=UPI00261E96EE|nr:HD domain-containing phosphohydrolase [uncultured Cetobacterium sp.]
MKKVLLYLLVTISLFASENVVLLENENSFFFYKKDGVSKGLYPKIFQDINKNQGLDLIVKELDTNLILDMEQGKDILIMDLVENEQRRKKYYFIPTFFYLKADMYFINREYEDITNFYQKRVGVIKGTYLDGQFKERYGFLKTVIIDIKTREDGLNMLKKGEIDGFVSDNQYGFSERLNTIALNRIDQMVTTLAVPKSNEKLYNILKKSFERISSQRLKEMISLSRVEYYRDKFGEKYSDLYNKEVNVLFPSEKSMYPLYYKENGKEKGVITDYLKDIEDILGIKTQKIFDTNFENYEDTEIVVATILGLKESRLNSNPYYTLNPVVFNRKKDGFITNILEVKKQKFAVVKGSFYLECLKKFLTEENFIYVKTLDEAMQKVANGEVDYGISDHKILSNKLYNGNYSNDLKIAGILDEKHSLSMSVNPKYQGLYEAINDISVSFLNENMSKNIYWLQNNYEVNDYRKLVIASLGMLFFSLFMMNRAKKGLKEKKRYEQLMMSLVGALEAVNQYNDTETGNHIKRLNLYSELLANKLGCSKKFCEEIGKVASLHDVGKIGIDRNILKKPGKLTEEEFEAIKVHSEIGYEIIKKSEISVMAENIARYHHEKWNGKGYPKGLKGEKIPLEARIVSVVDVYDALRQKRIYKDGFSHEKAIALIKAERGVSFDPKVVDIFIESDFKFERLFNINSKKE